MEEEQLDRQFAPRNVIGILLTTMQMHREIVRETVRHTGMHPTRHRMLMYLARSEPTFRQKELADCFGITPAAVVQNLDKLEEEGYVRREASESDSRCNRIHITSKGKSVVKASIEEFDRLDARLLADLSEDEIEVFVRVLRRMQENMSSSVPESSTP